MNNKKKMIPELRFPEFKNEGEWQKIKIDEIAKVSAGGTPESTNPKYWNGNIPWMNSGELNNKRIYSVSNYITSKGLKESSTKLIPPNCVLIGLAGQGKTRGTAAINYIELCTNQSIGSIHPNEDVFDSEFLYQKLDSMYEKLRSLSAGDGGRGGLNLQIIKEIELLLPKLNEQQKIASCLFSLDKLIEGHSQKLDLLKDHKKGLIQTLFPPESEKVPKYRFPEFEKDGEWEEKKIGDFITSLDAGVSVNSGDRPANGNEIGILKTSCIKEGVFDCLENKVVFENDEIDRVKESVKKDTIIISRMNTPVLVGANALVKKDYPNIFLPDRLWAAKSNGKGDIKFISHILSSAKGRYMLSELATGTSNSMKNITKGDVLDLLITVPSLPEQQKISSCLSDLDELIVAQAKKIEQLKRHKKGLIQGLFPKMND